MKAVDLAWAAGFIDGEGYIGVDRCGQNTNGYISYTVSLKVAQVVRAPLDKLQKLFGGKIREMANTGGNTIYHWRLFGDKALPVLQRLLPYLIVKHKAAVLAIEFRSAFPRRKHNRWNPISSLEWFHRECFYWRTKISRRMEAAEINYKSSVG